MRTVVAAVLAAVLATGCSESVNVSINCVTTAAPAVECTAQQTQGKGEVEACWDFDVTCGNGTVVKAPRSCVKLKDGSTEKVTIPGDKLTNSDQCAGDTKPVAKLSNTTLNGKAFELNPK
ncbi:MAG: hypothetical protein H0V17_35305 [Deltaproteobacteria bacterium]|nr:hypothetical protein [Deltaproteobacteria bacterium]